MAVSVAGMEGGGAAKGDEVAIGNGDITGEDGDRRRALGGGGGMLRGGAAAVASTVVGAVASGWLGATLRLGGGGGTADGLDCSGWLSAVTAGRGIKIGPVLPLGLGGAATGRGGTAELPELPLFDPSFSGMKPLLAQHERSCSR